MKLQIFLDREKTVGYQNICNTKDKSKWQEQDAKAAINCVGLPYRIVTGRGKD